MKPISNTELSFRRRLILLQLLHQRPYTRDELFASLDQHALFLYDREEDQRLIMKRWGYQLSKDLRALRDLDYDIRYDFKRKLYIWHNSPFGFVLQQEHLRVLALLQKTFAVSTLPHAQDIHSFLQDLIALLPREQQQALDKQFIPFHIDLGEVKSDVTLDVQTVQTIEKALEQRCQLAFRYRSPNHGKEFEHIIEPTLLRLEQGHVYLKGWQLERGTELRFRVDAIVEGSARLLPTQIVPSRPKPPSYLLRYHLSAKIARNGTSQRFPNQQVERHADGSVTITAQVTDLFETRQIVLKYGENCTVLSPPELLAALRPVAQHFARVYLSKETLAQLS